MNAVQVRAQACFLRACELDVAVRKPGNVSVASPGHGMHAALFSASAHAAAAPLFRAGARVGERIEAAVAASWAVAGCNTNLGILLLCAPLAVACERSNAAPAPARLRQALGTVLAELDLADARAAFRAIARANPGGLGSAPMQDVRAAPSLGLRAAMALAADRDLIARQYRDGFDDLFELTLPALPPLFSLGAGGPDAATISAVQRVYLTLLATLPDSHIVRKHGAAVAQNVMAAAQRFHALATQGGALDADPAFVAWDEELKAQHINPGTTADLTVATLLLAGVTGAPATEL